MILLSLGIAAPASADEPAELRAGLDMLGRSTDGASGANTVRPLDASGVFGVSVAGDLYLRQARAVDLGFYFRYERAMGLRSAITDDTGLVELDTHMSTGEIGAVARRLLDGGVGLRARLGMGRSQLTFRDDFGLSDLPDSDFRYLQLGGAIDKRFDIIRVDAGLELGRAFDLAGAPADVMGETAGVVYGGHAGVGFALNPSVEVQTNAGVTWLSAGEWSERHTRLEVALGVRL